MGVKVDGDYGTKHRILKILAWRYATANELAEILGISRQAVHYHLQCLIEWGFVVRNTEECIMATLLDPDKDLYLYYDGDRMEIIKGDECRPNERGEYYVYAANYYIRRLFPGRPTPECRSPPKDFIDIVKRRLSQLGVLSEVKGYDLILMVATLQLMAAVLWNPKPRGDSYWVRLKHLTTKGIHQNVGKFTVWYTSLKAATEAKRRWSTLGYGIEQRIAVKR